MGTGQVRGLYVGTVQCWCGHKSGKRPVCEDRSGEGQCCVGVGTGQVRGLCTRCSAQDLFGTFSDPPGINIYIYIY